jgi:hypothetical protein
LIKIKYFENWNFIKSEPQKIKFQEKKSKEKKKRKKKRKKVNWERKYQQLNDVQQLHKNAEMKHCRLSWSLAKKKIQKKSQEANPNVFINIITYDEYNCYVKIKWRQKKNHLFVC